MYLFIRIRGVTMSKSNALRYNNLYNEDSKKEFIEQYSSIDSKLTLFWQFLKVSDFEYNNEDKITKIRPRGIDEPKDISEMSSDEIKALLLRAECSTITSAINHINTYKRYIDWTIKFKENTNKNPFNEFESFSELASEVVASKKNIRYSREELLFMLDELNNHTDQALLLALFEGIKGKSFSELLTLRNTKEFLFSKDIDGEDRFFAKVYDEGSRDYRTLEISQDLFKLLRLADGQKAYRTNNEDEIIETLFNDSEFIFKKAKKGKQGNSELDRHFITRKFVFFKEFFGNHYLTADDIAQSGMMYMAYELYKKNNKIGKSELLDIGEHFNTIMASTARTENYRNITVLKRIIFTEQLGKLYSELKDIEYAD